MALDDEALARDVGVLPRARAPARARAGRPARVRRVGLQAPAAGRDDLDAAPAAAPRSGWQDRFHDILDELPRVREELGWPIMVTPLSQFVGVQAFLNVTTGERWSQMPDEVVQLRARPVRAAARARSTRTSRATVLASPRAEQLAHEEHGIDLDAARERLRRRHLRRAAPAADDAAGGAGRRDALRAARRAAGPAARRTPCASSSPVSSRATSLREIDIEAPGLRVRAQACRVTPVRRHRRGRLRRRRNAAARERPGRRAGRAADPRRDRAVARVRATRPADPLLHERHRPAAGAMRRPTSAGWASRSTTTSIMNPAVVAASYLERSTAANPCSCSAAPASSAPLRDRGIEIVDAAAPRARRRRPRRLGRHAELRGAARRVRVGLGGRPALRDVDRERLLRRAAAARPAGRARSWRASGRRPAPGRSRSGSRRPIALREMCRVLGSTPARTRSSATTSASRSRWRGGCGARRRSS